MARLLISNEWYEQVSGPSIYENDFERLIVRYASDLFPDYHVVEFKALVQSENGGAKADLALIHKEYRHWWVVEIEMAHHSLGGHVLPQVTTLHSARYGSAEVDYLCTHSGELDLASTRDMIKGAQPQVLVIVDRPVLAWMPDLSALGIPLMVVEVFRSDRNEHALHISGEYPTAQAEFLSICEPDRMLPRLLTVHSPAQLGVVPGAQLEIEIDGATTEWKRIDVADKVWLSPLRSNPLTSLRGPVRLIRLENGRLSIEGH